MSISIQKRIIKKVQCILRSAGGKPRHREKPEFSAKTKKWQSFILKYFLRRSLLGCSRALQDFFLMDFNICVKLYPQDGRSKLHFYLGLGLTVGYCIEGVRCSVLLAFYGNISTEYVKMCHFICIYAIRRRAGFYLIVKQLLQYTINNSSQCSRIQKIVHFRRNVEYFNVFLKNCSYYINLPTEPIVLSFNFQFAEQMGLTASFSCFQPDHITSRSDQKQKFG